MYIEIDLNDYSYAKGAHNGEGWFTAFTPEQCEKCDKASQGANSINLHLGDLPARELAQLDIRESLPGELGYCDTFGGAVCHDCYVGEPDDQS